MLIIQMAKAAATDLEYPQVHWCNHRHSGKSMMYYLLFVCVSVSLVT